MAALYRGPPFLLTHKMLVRGESILAVALSQYKRVHKISRRGNWKRHKGPGKKCRDDGKEYSFSTGATMRKNRGEAISSIATRFHKASVSEMLVPKIAIPSSPILHEFFYSSRWRRLESND